MFLKTILLINLSFIFNDLKSQGIEYTYRDLNDSTSNFYITIPPQKDTVGILILLPSFGESPKSVVIETEIYKNASLNGLITVIASLKEGWKTFYVDSTSQASLDELIQHLVKRYNLIGKKIYLGGFSLGGSGVVKYAERAYSSKYLIKPSAVFAIDPPLDFERLYYSVNSDNKLIPGADTLKNFPNYFLGRIINAFNGSPEGNSNSYESNSPYSFKNPKKNLESIAILNVLIICG
jgi:hypothetical protein